MEFEAEQVNDTPSASSEANQDNSEQQQDSQEQVEQSAEQVKDNSAQAKEYAKQVQGSLDPDDEELESFSSTHSHFHDSQFDTIYQGNQQVNVYQMYGRRGTTKGPENRAKKLQFPKLINQIEFLEAELLALRKNFLATNRWLVIEANADNQRYISDAIATLVADHQEHDYLVQQHQVKCKDYAQLPKLFANKRPSITKLPVEDLKSFKRFLDTRENMQALTESLTEGNNHLLLVIDSEQDIRCNNQIKSLVTNIGTDAEVAFWIPRIEDSTNSCELEYAELDWLGKALITLGSWFSAIPFALFYRIVEDLLTAKQKHSVDSGDEAFTQWLKSWQQDADQYLKNYNLENNVDIENGIAGISLTPLSAKEHYRKIQSSYSPNLLGALMFPLTDNLFRMTDSELGKPPSKIYSELARFYEMLHQNMLVPVDVALLEQLFERYRFATTGSAKTIYSFVYFLSALHKNTSLTATVENFVKQLVDTLHRDEKELKRTKHFEFTVNRRLPTLELEQRIDREIRQHLEHCWFSFRDRLYATFNILAWSIGLSHKLSLESLESIIAHSEDIAKKDDLLPSHYFFKFLLKQRLKLSTSDFQQTLESIATESALPESSFPLLSNMLLEYAKDLLAKASQWNGDDNYHEKLEYLFVLLFEQNAIEHLIDIKAQAPEQEDLINKLFLDAFIEIALSNEYNLKHREQSEQEGILEIQEDTTRRLSECLFYLAKSVDKYQYSELKQYLRDGLTEMREQARDRSQAKELRELAAMKKSAINLVKLHFNRNKKS